MEYFRNKVILLVETQVERRRLFEYELSQSGAIVFSATNEAQALEIFERHQNIVECIAVTTELPHAICGYEIFSVEADGERFRRRGTLYLSETGVLEKLCQAKSVTKVAAASHAVSRAAVPLDVLDASELEASIA